MPRRPREEAELAAWLRSKRAFDKKMSDIAWMYEEFDPLMKAFQNGELALDYKQTPFELEVKNDETDNLQ